jgi:hypothetical protein
MAAKNGTKGRGAKAPRSPAHRRRHRSSAACHEHFFTTAIINPSMSVRPLLIGISKIEIGFLETTQSVPETKYGAVKGWRRCSRRRISAKIRIGDSHRCSEPRMTRHAEQCTEERSGTVLQLVDVRCRTSPSPPFGLPRQDSVEAGRAIVGSCTYCK